MLLILFDQLFMRISCKQCNYCKDNMQYINLCQFLLSCFLKFCIFLVFSFSSFKKLVKFTVQRYRITSKLKPTYKIIEKLPSLIPWPLLQFRSRIPFHKDSCVQRCDFWQVTESLGHCTHLSINSLLNSWLNVLLGRGICLEEAGHWGKSWRGSSPPQLLRSLCASWPQWHE